MQPSLIEFRNQLGESLVSFLWRQWSSLGVAGHSTSSDRWLMDPEALLLFTCTIGRQDARLFDEVLDWLSVNGSFINVQRMRGILTAEKFAGRHVLAGIAAMRKRSADAARWKPLMTDVEPLTPAEALFFMPDHTTPLPVFGEPHAPFARFGLLRDDPKLRGYSQPFRPNEIATFALQLRALFGVNARAEIVQYLLTHEAGHPAEIARQTYFYQKTIQDALVDMYRSGVVEVRSRGREKHYWMKMTQWADLLNRAADAKMPYWIAWPSVLGALERIWLKLQDSRLSDTSPLMLASELRELMNEIRPALENAGFSASTLSPRQYTGAEFTTAFLADVRAILG